MNTYLKHGLAIVALVALLVGASLAGAEEDGDGTLSLDGLAAELAKAQITLSAACKTAEDAAKGKAFAAEFEVEDGKVLYDVFVLVPGTPPKLFEVEVDAVTGKVIEIEEESLVDEDDEEDDAESED